MKWEKDEIWCVLRNHSAGVEQLAHQYGQLISGGSEEAAEALEKLRERYAEVDSVGPVAVSQFVNGANDDDLQADARVFFLNFVEATDLNLTSEDGVPDA